MRRETRYREFFCYPRDRTVIESYEVVAIGPDSRTARHSCESNSSECPRCCKFLAGALAFGVIDPELPPAQG